MSRGSLLARMLLAAAVALGVGLLAAPAAQAHDQLRGTEPADKATVTTAPVAVKITFTDVVLPGTAQVRVTGPGGVVSTGQVATKAGTVAAALAPDLPDGGYTVDWKITSADGHPVSGTFTFTLATGGSAATSGGSSPSAESTAPSAGSTASPGATASAGVGAAPSASASLDTTPVASTTTAAAAGPSPWPVVVAVLVTLAVVGGLWWSRSRRAPSPGR